MRNENVSDVELDEKFIWQCSDKKAAKKKVIYYLKYAVALKNVELVYVNLPVNP